MKLKIITLFCFVFFTVAVARGKETDKEFIEKNLKTTTYAIDTEASAVILFENTAVEITEEYSNFSKKETIHRIIKILRPEALAGVSNAANVRIYISGEERNNYVSAVRGTTYNIGKDSLLQTQLKQEDVYRKNIQGNLYEVSFSMPAVQVGSIVEYYYEKVTVYGANSIRWHLQGEYPKLVSEFEISYPDQFAFTSVSNLIELPKEYQSKEDARLGPDNFCHVVSKFKYGTLQQGMSYWHKRNVQALTNEPFVHNRHNYEERIDILVTGYRLNNSIHKLSNNWERLNSEFWDNDKGGVGRDIMGGNRYLGDIIDSLSRQYHYPLQLAKGIFSYVRTNVQCNSGKAFSPGRGFSLSTVFKNRVGNIFEVNLLLTAMLLEAGIESAPVLLSTKKNPSLTELQPVKDNINYMVVLVRIDGKRYLLDASNKYNSFGQLPNYCYNGFAWVLGSTGYGIDLTHDMLEEKHVCAVKISDFTDTTASIQLTLKWGQVYSQQLRQEWDGNEKNIQELINDYVRLLPEGTMLKERNIINLQDPDTSLVLRMDCVMPIDTSMDMLYIKNELTPLFNNNPLKAAKRKFPIEFPCKSDYSYFLSIALPPNMVPEQMPKPIKLSYDNDKMTYQRSMNYTDGLRSVTSNIRYTANSIEYDASEYASMVDFFKNMIEEGTQVIAIKKVK